MDNKEIEIKFGVLGHPDNLMAILGSLGRVSNERSDKLENIYFDTPDQKLFALGAGLRLRRGAKFTEQTLKLRGETLGGMHQRGEYNAPAERDCACPDLSKFPKEIFPENFELQAVQRALRPLCEIDFVRRSFDFELMDCAFEVAYDQGGIKLGEDTSYPINELEVELKDSNCSEDDIMRIFCALITTFAEKNLPLVQEPFSKMHRAGVLLFNTRNELELGNFSIAGGDPGSYIASLLKNYENLYGLFLLKQDPLVFSYLNSTLEILIQALKQLRRSGKAAFIQEDREPLNYSHDLKVIIDILKSYLKRSRRFEKAVNHCAFTGDVYALSALVEELRGIENRYKFYVIPLKLKVLLSMLVK